MIFFLTEKRLVHIFKSIRNQWLKILAEGEFPHDSVGEGSDVIAVALVTIVAQGQFLALELPHATGVALKGKQQTNKQKTSIEMRLMNF